MKIVVDLVRTIPWGRSQDRTFINLMATPVRKKLWSFSLDRLRAGRDPMKLKIDGGRVL